MIFLYFFQEQKPTQNNELSSTYNLSSKYINYHNKKRSSEEIITKNISNIDDIEIDNSNSELEKSEEENLKNQMLNKHLLEESDSEYDIEDFYNGFRKISNINEYSPQSNLRKDLFENE